MAKVLDGNYNKKKKNGFDNYTGRNYDMANLEKRLVEGGINHEQNKSVKQRLDGEQHYDELESDIDEKASERFHTPPALSELMRLLIF